MPEALEMAGRGVRITFGVLVWAAFAIAIVVCAPFMALGWLGYRLGWID